MRPWWLSLALVACSAPRTEMMFGVATDIHAPDLIDSVELQVTRAKDGFIEQQVFWQITGVPSMPFNLPGSYGVYSPDGSETQLDVQLIAMKGNTTVVTRHAILSLVNGQTLFYRLGLTVGCVGHADCGPAQTCVEGMCRDLQLDSHMFPTFQQDLVGQLTCNSGTNYIDTSTGAPMPLAPGGDACPASLCSEGTCLQVPASGGSNGPASDAGMTVPPPDGGSSTGLPSMVMSAWTGSGGTFTPATMDLSCLAAPRSDPSTTVTVSLSTTVHDLQTGNADPSLAVTAFPGIMSASTLASGTTNASGVTTLSIPSGQQRLGFKVAGGTSAVDTYTLDTLLAPSTTSQAITLRSVSTSTASTLAGLVGATQAPGTSIELGVAHDCMGHQLAGVVATISSVRGQVVPLPGTQSFYYDDSVGLPVQPSKASSSARDGQFMILQVPATANAFLQVWGYRTTAELNAHTPTLIEELPVFVPSSSALLTVQDPRAVP